MALVELSMLEQRYLAVREVLDTGASVTDVATRHGVDRRTLHRWLLRYANEGMAALADKSSKPDTCPHQISAVVEARIIAMRTAHRAGVRERSAPSWPGSSRRSPRDRPSIDVWSARV